MILDTFFSLHLCRDFKEFYRLPPWGIYIMRNFELMTSITKDGISQMTNKDEEVVQVQITNKIINEALHFKAN